MRAHDKKIGFLRCIDQCGCGPSVADARMNDDIGMVALDNLEDIAEQHGRISGRVIVSWQRRYSSGNDGPFPCDEHIKRRLG